VFQKVDSWCVEWRKKVASMEVGSEVVHSNVSSVLDQLHQLESDNVDAQIRSLIDSVNSAITKLPADSPLRTHWQKTRSEYDEVVASINVRRVHRVEARTRPDLDAKDSCRKAENSPLRSSANISNPLSMRQQSSAGNPSPPVCHVKPTQLLNEASTSSSSAAPFDVRNYLIDKNAPIAEPIFNPQLTAVVRDFAVNSSSEAVRRRSYDAAVDLPCMRPVGGNNAPVRSTVKPPTVPSLPPVCSRWKVLRRKAVGLFIDGLGRSPGLQSEHSSPRQLSDRPACNTGLQRSEYSCLLILYTVSKERTTLSLSNPLSSTNINLFSQFFHWHIVIFENLYFTR